MTENDARTLGTQIDSLLEELESTAEPAVCERVEHLVGAIVGLYGAGLERAVAILREQGAGEGLVRALAGDDLLANLLALHDLHPDDTSTRIQAALDRVRPYLGSHAGGIDYLGIDGEGVVQLRLEGSCDGCPSSTVTVRLAVEQAVLDAAPEANSVAVEGMVEEPAGQPLLQIPRFQPHAGTDTDQGDDGWQHIAVDVAPGELCHVEVGELGVVVCNLHGTWYGYRDSCASCGAELNGGRLHGDELTCPTCAATYDVHLAGRGTGDTTVALEALPLLQDETGWRIAVPGRVPV